MSRQDNPPGHSDLPDEPLQPDQLLLADNVIYRGSFDHVVAEFSRIPTGLSRARNIAIGIGLCVLALAGAVWLAASNTSIPRSIVLVLLLLSLLSPLFVLYLNPPRASYALMGSAGSVDSPPALRAEIDDTVLPARDVRALRVIVRGHPLGTIELLGISRGTPARVRVIDQSGGLVLEGRAVGSAKHLAAALVLNNARRLLDAMGNRAGRIEEHFAKHGMQTWTLIRPAAAAEQARIEVPPSREFASRLVLSGDLTEDEETLVLVIAWALTRE